METLSRNGGQFRTKLMSLGQAEQFAKCLRANPRFVGVSVNFSTRAKETANRFVTFLPTSDPSGQRILDRQQGARDQRAAEQIGNYTFLMDDSCRFYYCWNTVSGEVYETTTASCTCPDHEFRGRAAGVNCKHMTMLATHLAECDRAFPAPAFNIERARADRDALWG